jgi:hypothetical protein
VQAHPDQRCGDGGAVTACALGSTMPVVFTSANACQLWMG